MAELLDEEDNLSGGYARRSSESRENNSFFSFGATQGASNDAFNDDLLLEEEDLLGPDDSLTHTASVSSRTAVESKASTAQAESYQAGRLDPTLPPRKSDVHDANYDVQLDFDEDIEDVRHLHC